MRRLLPVLFFMLAISGCESVSQQEASLMKAQLEAKTLVVSCDKCEGFRAEWTDPNRALAMPTNGWDAVNSVTSTLAGALVGVAPYVAIREGFRYMGQSTSYAMSGSHNQSSNRSSTDLTSSYQTESVSTTTRTEQPLFMLPGVQATE